MGVRINLPESAWKQVCDQAGREWRTPQQQAEYLILRALGWHWPPEDEQDAPEPSAGMSVPAQRRQPVREGGGAS